MMNVLARTRDRHGARKEKRLELRASASNVFHIRNQKVTRVVTCYDRDRAFADLGLKAEALEPAKADRTR
jgi:hypothetical protein